MHLAKKRVQCFEIPNCDKPETEAVIVKRYTEKETKKYKMKIVKLAYTTHNEMDDNANDEQRKEIQEYIMTFIND
jgi:hypothetical protein